MAAGALLLLMALAFTPLASAQDPVHDVFDPRATMIGFVVTCPETLVYVEYANAAETECYLHDLSRDSMYFPGGARGPGYGHVTTMEVVNQTPGAIGWQVLLSRTFFSTTGGDVAPFTVRIQTSAVVNTQSFDFGIHAIYTGPDGRKDNVTIPFHAEVAQFDRALVEVRTEHKVQRAGQGEIVRYEVRITNDGVYPDIYRVSAKSDPDIYVTQPPSVYVPPGETRNVTISVLTPKGKVYEVGRSTQLNIKVASATGSGVYTTVGTLQIRGPYISTAWLPLTVVGLASTMFLVQRTRERAELRRLEKGRPGRIEPTPRQAVLLKELRRKDPEAYKARMAEMRAQQRALVADWRAHRKERIAADREEAKQARLEFKAAKKRKKLEEKERRAQAKREEKERRIQERLEAKERAKKEKVLAKKRKALEKEKAKLEKKQAKLDAKQAKADAKRAAAEEKARRKAERAAAKAAKKNGGGEKP